MKPAPGFLEAFVHVNKTVDFNGRARRAEYWKFTAIWSCIFLPLFFLIKYAQDTHNSSMLTLSCTILGLICLGLFFQSVSLCVRRLHDSNRSGVWFFLNLIPLIGSIILIVWLCADSTPGDNQYGPSPKYSDNNSSSNESV